MCSSRANGHDSPEEWNIISYTTHRSRSWWVLSLMTRNIIARDVGCPESLSPASAAQPEIKGTLKISIVLVHHEIQIRGSAHFSCALFVDGDIYNCRCRLDRTITIYTIYQMNGSDLQNGRAAESRPRGIITNDQWQSMGYKENGVHYFSSSYVDSTWCKIIHHRAMGPGDRMSLAQWPSKLVHLLMPQYNQLSSNTCRRLTSTCTCTWQLDSSKIMPKFTMLTSKGQCRKVTEIELEAI